MEDRTQLSDFICLAGRPQGEHSAENEDAGIAMAAADVEERHVDWC